MYAAGMETKAEANGRGGERRRPQARERERIVEEWTASGRTVEEMAAATGWTRWTMYRWRAEAREGRRPRKRDSERTMMAVPRPPDGDGWVAELQAGQGWMLRLPEE